MMNDYIYIIGGVKGMEGAVNHTEAAANEPVGYPCVTPFNFFASLPVKSGAF